MAKEQVEGINNNTFHKLCQILNFLNSLFTEGIIIFDDTGGNLTDIFRMIADTLQITDNVIVRADLQ